MSQAGRDDGMPTSFLREAAAFGGLCLGPCNYEDRIIKGFFWGVRV